MHDISKIRSILRDLIAFETVTHQNNLAMAEYICGLLEPLGTQVAVQQHPDGSRANLFCTFGERRDDGIVLSGHTDVVPVSGQDWTHNAFDMIERDGKLFGRGTCDMKGFIAVCLAKAELIAQRSAALRRPIHFAFTYDEEVGCMGAQHLMPFIQQTGVKPAIAIIGEPTSMGVIEGHKGCHEFCTTVHGLAGHSAHPDRGVNAIEIATRYIAELMGLQEQLKNSAGLARKFDPPYSTLSVGTIKGGLAHNIVPAHCEFEWQIRQVQEADVSFVVGHMEKFVKQELHPEMQAVHAGLTVETSGIAGIPGLSPVPDNEARQITHALLGTHDSDVVSFGTEAGLFQQIGIASVVCGPGSIHQAHKPDEFVEISQLAKCSEFLDQLVESVTLR